MGVNIGFPYLQLFPCLSVAEWFELNLWQTLRCIELEMLGLTYSKTSVACLSNERIAAANLISSSSSNGNNRSGKTKSYKLCPHGMTT